jgi:hypothetical protein
MDLDTSSGPQWIALLALTMATSARPGIHDWMHALAEMKRNLRGPIFQAPLRRKQPQRCNTFFQLLIVFIVTSGCIFSVTVPARSCIDHQINDLAAYTRNLR